jgi:Iron-containing redox enzyme
LRLPKPRGPLSAEVIDGLRAGTGPDLTRFTGLVTRLSPSCDPLCSDDFQLALWLLFELHYRGFEDVDADLEWDANVLQSRRLLERRFEHELRLRTGGHVQRAQEAGPDVADQLWWLVQNMEGPRLAAYVQREATHAQVLEYLAVRSLYHLKESDPHSFVFPRIDGRAKVALAELQYDEYGAGRPDRLHQTLYGDALEAAGLDRSYGAYVELTPGHVMAVNNVMSLFGLHRRLRGAAMGHLAAFEATSSTPCRKIAGGIERVGLPAASAAYYLEHVEADAVHEQVAIRDICGALVADEPALREDVLFGAACCLYLDAVSATRVLDAWQAASSGPQRELQATS